MKEIGLIERLQLIKAGYNKKEINEMIMMANQETPESEELPENTPRVSAEPEAEKEQPKAASDENNDVPDYKQMFEDLQKEHEETKRKLDAAQKANASADVSMNVKPKEDSQTKINNIFKEIIS